MLLQAEARLAMDSHSSSRESPASERTVGRGEHKSLSPPGKKEPSQGEEHRCLCSRRPKSAFGCVYGAGGGEGERLLLLVMEFLRESVLGRNFSVSLDSSGEDALSPGGRVWEPLTS